VLVVGRQPHIPVDLKARLFTLEEARVAGLSPRQLEGSSWQRVERGVYRWANFTPGPLLQLAVIARRLPGAVFSGRTAGWLHGLDLLPSDPVEMIIQDFRISRRAGLRLERTTLGTGDVVRMRGLPVTSALRTAVDLGSRRPLLDAVIALDMALHRRLVSLPRLRIYLDCNRGVRGIANLRRAIELAEPATESPMETRLRILLVKARLPRPHAQVLLKDQHGRILGRPDFYYPEHRLGLEYDGASHRDSLVADNRRQNLLLNAGYRLLRFTAADIFQEPESVIAQVRLAMSQRWPVA
jgi:very-short-patch-repair endonuclease